MAKDKEDYHGLKMNTKYQFGRIENHKRSSY